MHPSPEKNKNKNVSVPESVPVSVSAHIESCTLYFYFLDFYRGRFRIRTNGIAWKGAWTATSVTQLIRVFLERVYETESRVGLSPYQ